MNYDDSAMNTLAQYVEGRIAELNQRLENWAHSLQSRVEYPDIEYDRIAADAISVKCTTAQIRELEAIRRMMINMAALENGGE